MKNTNKKTIYQQMVEVLPSEKISNHGSDLYVEVNEQTKEIVHEYEFKNNVTIFISEIEKTPWFDIPLHMILGGRKELINNIKITERGNNYGKS